MIARLYHSDTIASKEVDLIPLWWYNGSMIRRPEMPKLGDVTGRDKLGLAGRSAMIWVECPNCKQPRWTSRHIYVRRGGDVWCRPCNTRRMQEKARGAPHKVGCDCPQCRTKHQWGERNPSWRGGRQRSPQGYILVNLPPDHRFREMGQTNNRVVFEHRLVMAEYLGRPLIRRETVHHRNGIKDDNRIENLELWVGNHGKGQRVEELHCPGCRCFDHEEVSK